MKEVFFHPSYAVFALLIAVSILVFAIWLPNLSFVGHVVSSPTYSTGGKFSILWSSLGALKTNFTAVSRTLTILIALLTGMNFTLFAYYLKRRFRLEKSAGTSVLGMTAGLLGIGCASCGSVLLSSIFGLSATAGFIGVLPLRGSEFGILGVLLLIWSNYSLALKIRTPMSCSIDGR